MTGRSGLPPLGMSSTHHTVPWQVDELYEGYCIQCRLRDGASNMQRAFSRCPPSRASRESLQELGRSLQECAEVGCSGAPEGSGRPGPGSGGWGVPWAPRKLCALASVWQGLCVTPSPRGPG